MARCTASIIGFVLLCALSGCPPPPPPPSTSSIVGQVVNGETRQAIANARVILRQGQTNIGEKMTNGQGKFEFANLDAGSYTLFVAADGFVSAEHGVTLTAGQRRTVTVELLPDSSAPPSDVPIVD